MTQQADQIVALLESRYGLTVEQLAPAPRGWTGETFAATIRGGERVFVKIYPKERLPPTVIPALPAVAELYRLGLTCVSRPIPTTSGALHEWLGGDPVVVFAYLDAPRAPFTYGGERLGDLIARVHQQTKHITRPPAREAFAPVYGDALWQTLDRARQEPAVDEPRRGLRQFLDEQGTAIAHAWAAFGEIARACRTASFELVLTHGDWPFNLLQSDDGVLYLIDWDDLLLAPAERDTWFADDDSAFWRGYRARRGDHTVNDLATAYYVHTRYFEDLLGFAQVILGEGTPEQHPSWGLALLRNEWVEGLGARIRRLHSWQRD